MAKKKTFSKKAFIIASLRKASYRWSPRTAAFTAARVSRGLYCCNLCKGEFSNKEVALDHVNPVVDPVEGFTTWDEYIKRMFCEVDGFQVLCDTCHTSKTMTERELRKQYRKLRKDETDE
jgi:hypothetical protein